MFAGSKQKSSTNVRSMQLFHELKQQFPTIPDHIVNSCIAQQSTIGIDDLLTPSESAQTNIMGRSISEVESSENSTISSTPLTLYNIDNTLQRTDIDNNTSDNNLVESERFEANVNMDSALNTPNSSKDGQCDDSAKPKRFLKRPTQLNVKTGNSNIGKRAGHRIQQSERHCDLHKLLNNTLEGKPPRSPSHTSPTHNLKHSPLLPSPEIVPNRDELVNNNNNSVTTVETQTTKTLLPAAMTNLNVSLNVQCLLDKDSSTKPKHVSNINLVPQRHWMQQQQQTDGDSPRSYTSVNLTLRPPTSEPQAPIDILSQNSSLTYSTSSFDRKKGLQSRLQITVGPSGGSVSSVRTRPRSSYHPEEEGDVPVGLGSVVGGSLPDLLAPDVELPLVEKQHIRIEKLRIELQTEKGRLVVMKKEVMDLEIAQKVLRPEVEIENQLQKEIKHLRGQCELLANEVDQRSESRAPLGETSKEFYENIYTGQQGSISLLIGRDNDSLLRDRDATHSGTQQQQQQLTGRRHYQQQDACSIRFLQHEDNNSHYWNCSICTFRNHPLLNKCEQCEMLRDSTMSVDNVHIHITPRLNRRTTQSWVT